MQHVFSQVMRKRWVGDQAHACCCAALQVA
jgi:hypothetical protein